jgi:hypothetical protein
MLVPGPDSKGTGDGVTSVRECFLLEVQAKEFALQTIKLIAQA